MKTALSWLGIGMATTLLLCACGVRERNSCPREYCGDEYVSEVDSGNAFNLEIGQEIVERLENRSTPADAYTNNPSVLKQLSKPNKEFVSRPILTTGFVAVGTGSARIGMVYLQCQESSQSPCKFEFEVNVIQFPKTDATVSIDVNDTSGVSMRSGESVRLNAPSDPSDTWNVLIDNPKVLRWSFEPIVVPYRLSGVMEATGVGTAHVEANLKSGSQPWWGKSWQATVTVAN